MVLKSSTISRKILSILKDLKNIVIENIVISSNYLFKQNKKPLILEKYPKYNVSEVFQRYHQNQQQFGNKIAQYGSNYTKNELIIFEIFSYIWYKLG